MGYELGHNKDYALRRYRNAKKLPKGEASIQTANLSYLISVANSVILFDEARMLPTEHLRPCVAGIAKLVEQFRATAVLCTATQPVLNDLIQRYAPGWNPLLIYRNPYDRINGLFMISLRDNLRAEAHE